MTRSSDTARNKTDRLRKFVCCNNCLCFCVHLNSEVVPFDLTSTFVLVIMSAPPLSALLLTITTLSAEKCKYNDNSRAYDRLAVDQETTLIPKVCFDGDVCENNVCVRDFDILSPTVGCIWCDNKDSDSCDTEPSAFVDCTDYYDCFNLTPESCG